MIYDVLLVGFIDGRRPRRVTRWVRGIHADSLTEASDKAIQKFPHLGCVPSEVSMAWPVWPQP